LSLLSLISSLVLTELGLLSILVGAAYWSAKGSGVAAAFGLLLVIIGSRFFLAYFRRLKDKRRKPRV
jgi:energy-converting hydrogenase Eha subunit C